MVPTPRFTRLALPTNKPTSQLLSEIEDFRDFAYSVDAAAKNRAKMIAAKKKMKVFSDYVGAEDKRDELAAKLSVVDWIDAHVSADLRPYQRKAIDAMTVTVDTKTTQYPTDAEMIAAMERLQASSVGRNWLQHQMLASSMAFDPIGDHVRGQRPRGRFVQIDDAGDPDGGWWGRGGRS